MSVISDYGIVKYEDGVLTVNLTPPVAVGGWAMAWTLQKRFGHTGNPIAVNYLSSGFNGVSGITVTNSGQGTIQIQLPPQSVMSGRDFGNYANELRRVDSGFNTSLTQGFMQYGAGIG